MMKIIDSNLLIYSSQEEYFYLRAIFQKPDVFVSAISKVEVLGFNKLSHSDRVYFEALFRQLPSLGVTEVVIDKATELRQLYKFSLGDAIIAATVLLNNAVLLTRNTSDFMKIKEISVVNPFLS
jgi:toxin FitB